MVVVGCGAHIFDTSLQMEVYFMSTEIEALVKIY
jgi:hypothetical protein